jgi:protein O-mannosyl-transferase
VGGQSLSDFSESALSAKAGKRRIPQALCVSLLIVAAAYLQAIFFEFVYDDFEQIVYNPGIKSWDLALGYFKSHVWAQTGGVALYYRPLFMLWLTANHALFGLNPLYWHVAAIALHLLSCALLYFFVCRLTADRWVAVVAVLLFGLHPAHVESVAWVSGTTDTLSSVLLLGALLCYLRQRDSWATKVAVWRLTSLVLACLAVLAKEMALVIPALIFSYEWIFPQRDASRKERLVHAVRAAVPYALISIGYLIVRALALQRMTPPHTNAEFGSVLLAWPRVLMFYLIHALFPFRLSVFTNLVTVKHPGLENFVLPVVLLSLGLAVVCYGSGRSRVFAFLSAWCAIMVVPMLSVTFLYSVENVHDRYLYLLLAGLCIMLASLLARLREIGSSRSAHAALIAIAAGYTFVTVRESRYWADDIALAEHGIALARGHPLAPQVLGNAYIRQGQIREAIPYLLDSLDAMPDNVDSLCSLAICYSEIDAFPLAQEQLAKAIARDPLNPRAHQILGIIRLRQNRLEEAEAEIRRAIELKHGPNAMLQSHYYLGEVLYAQGNAQGAMREYRLEVLNDPAFNSAVAAAQTRIDQLERQLRMKSPQDRQ